MQRGEGAGGVGGVDAHGGEDAELLGESFADLAGEGVDVAGAHVVGHLDVHRTQDLVGAEVVQHHVVGAAHIGETVGVGSDVVDELLVLRGRR